MRHSVLIALSCSAALAAQLPPSTTGDLLVSSSGGDRLLRLAYDGEQLAVLAYPGLGHPRGIARRADGSVFVASQRSHEILVLDAELRLTRRFPTNPVRDPTGIAFGPNGNLYVSGFTTNDVGEFTPAGKYLRRYSGGGLAGTNCVAFLADGSFYAASAMTGRVVQFDKNGRPVRSFTGFGLSSPMGIAILGGELFVAGGGSDNVVVFDLAGKPLRQVRHADISGPQGVAATADGRLVTSSYYNHKIVWFTPAGQHLRTARPAASSVPRSLAFLTGVSIESTGKPVLGTPFPMTLESRHEAGLPYATGMSLGNAPGIPLPGGRRLPLMPDPLLELSLSGLPAFGGFAGRLDAGGRARMTLTLPNLPVLRGLRVHAAAVSLDPAYSQLFRQVSRASSWTL